MSFEEPWACIGIASSATMGSIADSKLDMGPVLHKGDVPRHSHRRWHAT